MSYDSATTSYRTLSLIRHFVTSLLKMAYSPKEKTKTKKKNRVKHLNELNFPCTDFMKKDKTRTNR